MGHGMRSGTRLGAALAWCALACGCCAPYPGIVRPVPQLTLLSPELEKLSDFKIDTYLKAQARPVFPTTLAVAKVRSQSEGWRPGVSPPQAPQLATLRAEEAVGWRSMVGRWGPGAPILVGQVQLVNPLVLTGPPTLKNLRDAAAQLHAPLLFVYMETDNAAEGYNEAAMAYWTGVGLFAAPGNSVGQYTVCQGLLVDTRRGFILATADGEGRREEQVPFTALDVTRDYVRRCAQIEACAALQKRFREAMTEVARTYAAPIP